MPYKPSGTPMVSSAPSVETHNLPLGSMQALSGHAKRALKRVQLHNPRGDHLLHQQHRPRHLQQHDHHPEELFQ